MSKPILEFLEALGVNVKKGAAKMECPSCHELKLTASEKKNVATCWACNKRFIPGDKRDNATPRWQARVMNAIASRCLKNLPERENTLNYLVKKRKLPADVAWLQANGVGSVPDRLPIDQLKELAEKVLGEDMKLACAGAGSAQLKALKDLENLERENIRDFFRTLTGVMNSADVPGAVAFIYTNHRGHCTSINCRLHSVQVRGKGKPIRRIHAG